MNTDKHTVTIPLADYNELLKGEELYNKNLEVYKSELARLYEKSRQFVSALSFLEDKGLLSDFNKSMNKNYKLEKVGISEEFKKLVSE